MTFPVLLSLDYVSLPDQIPTGAVPAMERAIELARTYYPHPNPRVGCVILSAQGQIIGEGAHQRYGGDHAEIAALRSAGEAARLATVFVTLEPCSHFGKTPPCAQALIKAGVEKVFAGTVDPDRRVRGRGLQQLEKANIKTWVGLCREQVLTLNPDYHQNE